MKERADKVLVERGLAASRERARALILAGKVYAGERRIEKAGDWIASETELNVRGQDHAYVSRGGVKLEGALSRFALNVSELVAADIGASTGGFTDCLLQRGTKRVYAIDVGYGQLHEKLRADARVVVMERINARYLNAQSLPELVDLVVMDASFIGLEKLLPGAKAILAPGGHTIALVKPQFEVGPKKLKRGVVKDDMLRQEAISHVAAQAQALGFQVLGQADSSIRGPAGNLETFLLLQNL